MKINKKIVCMLGKKFFFDVDKKEKKNTKEFFDVHML